MKPLILFNSHYLYLLIESGWLIGVVHHLTHKEAQDELAAELLSRMYRTFQSAANEYVTNCAAAVKPIELSNRWNRTQWLASCCQRCTVAGDTGCKLYRQTEPLSHVPNFPNNSMGYIDYEAAATCTYWRSNQKQEIYQLRCCCHMYPTFQSAAGDISTAELLSHVPNVPIRSRRYNRLRSCCHMYPTFQ